VVSVKFIFKVIFFMIFFNLAAFFIAYTGFFPNTIYGDVMYSDSLDNPNELPTAEGMFMNLVTNTNGGIANFSVPILGEVTLTFAGVIGLFTAVGAVIAIATHSMIPIVTALIGIMFTVMYSNSKSLFDAMITDLGGAAQYLMLIFGVGMLIMIILTIMDYAAGQHTTGG
jgi:hypothetical protein